MNYKQVNNPEPLCGGLLGAKVCIEFKITQQEPTTNTVCVTVKGKLYHICLLCFQNLNIQFSNFWLKGTYPFLGTSVTELGCETVSQNLI